MLELGQSHAPIAKLGAPFHTDIVEKHHVFIGPSCPIAAIPLEEGESPLGKIEVTVTWEPDITPGIDPQGRLKSPHPKLNRHVVNFRLSIDPAAFTPDMTDNLVLEATLADGHSLIGQVDFNHLEAQPHLPHLFPQPNLPPHATTDAMVTVWTSPDHPDHETLVLEVDPLHLSQLNQVAFTVYQV